MSFTIGKHEIYCHEYKKVYNFLRYKEDLG